MSYPTPEPWAAPPDPARPATVVAASWLLIAVAALFVVDFILSVSTSGAITDVYREVYEGTDLEGTEGTTTLIAIGAAAFNLLLAAGLVVLAFLDYRGKQPARIVTWVIGGIALCCTGVGLLVSAASDAFQIDMEGVPDAAEIQRMIDENLPDWFYPVSWTVTIVSVLALIAALVLLALPSSNEFFRRQQQPPAEPPPPYPQAGS